MKCIDDTRTCTPIPVFEAVTLGIPAPGRVFVPHGRADLRAVVYGPATTREERTFLALCTLFPEELDPGQASYIASLLLHGYHSTLLSRNIILHDLATGPSGSSRDWGAALALEIAESRGKARGKKCLPVVAAFPCGTSETLRSAKACLAAWQIRDSAATQDGSRGVFIALVSAQELLDPVLVEAEARCSGDLFIVPLSCRPDQLAGILEAVALAASGEIMPALERNPVFLFMAILLETITFSESSRGFSGEIYSAMSGRDSFRIASGLWTWGLGLPATGLILSEWISGRDVSAVDPDMEPEKKNSGELFNGEQIEVNEHSQVHADPVVRDFSLLKPGILPALARCCSPGPRDFEKAHSMLERAGEESLDSRDIEGLACAVSALDEGYVYADPDASRIMVRRTWRNKTASGTPPVAGYGVQTSEGNFPSIENPETGLRLSKFPIDERLLAELPGPVVEILRHAI